MNDVNKETDVVLKHIPLGKWFMLAGIVFCVIALFTWIFFGEITTTLTLNGVVATDKLPGDIYMGEAGYVTHQSVWSGDWVEKGTHLLEYIPEGIMNSEKNGAITFEDLEKYKRYVEAPYDGYIVNTYFTKGTQCEVMQPVVSIAKADKTKKVVAMARDYELNILKKGMDARIKLEAYSNDEDGYITGKISYVGEIFMPKEQLKEYLGSDQVVDSVVENNEEYFPVIIDIDCDENGNPIWHNRTNKGNNTDVRYGMLCSIDFTTMTCHPSKYLFS